MSYCSAVNTTAWLLVLGVSVATIFPAEVGAATTNTGTLRLTGITWFGEFKRVYVVHEERGQALHILTLREGRTVWGLQLLHVDAQKGEVVVLRNGNEQRLSFNEQKAAERHAQNAEKTFVEEHTRAHEALQRRERERLARESALANP